MPVSSCNGLGSFLSSVFILHMMIMMIPWDIKSFETGGCPFPILVSVLYSPCGSWRVLVLAEGNQLSGGWKDPKPSSIASTACRCEMAALARRACDNQQVFADRR